MNRRLSCLLLLLVTTTNAAGADDDLTDNRAALRSMRLELDSTGAALQSMRLALDAVIKENDALSARLRAIEPVPTADPTDATIPGKKHDSSNARRLTDSGATASIDFDGTDLQISSPVAVSGDLAASGAVSGASVAASGAVSGASLTSTGAATVGGDLTVSGYIYPTVVAFSATGTSTSTITVSNTLPFNSELFDIGGGYNPSSYTFTAPVKGVYSFTATASSTGSYSVMKFVYNSNTIEYATYGTTYWMEQSSMLVKELNANDQIRVFCAVGSFRMADSVPVSQFSGFLVGAT